MALDRMMGLKRTHYCGTLTRENEGNTVTVCGWVQRQRDLGGLIFVDLRDRTGIVQLAFDDNTAKDIFEKAAALHSEYVVMAEGKVRIRSAINTEIPTGEIEIEVTTLKVLTIPTLTRSFVFGTVILICAVLIFRITFYCVIK